MSKLDKIKSEIEKLSSEDFAEIFRWLSEMDWERWDQEIEAGSRTGKLDFLEREAREENTKRNIPEL